MTPRTSPGPTGDPQRPDAGVENTKDHEEYNKRCGREGQPGLRRGQALARPHIHHTRRRKAHPRRQAATTTPAQRTHDHNHAATTRTSLTLTPTLETTGPNHTTHQEDTNANRTRRMRRPAQNDATQTTREDTGTTDSRTTPLPPHSYHWLGGNRQQRPFPDSHREPRCHSLRRKAALHRYRTCPARAQPHRPPLGGHGGHLSRCCPITSRLHPRHAHQPSVVYSPPRRLVACGFGSARLSQPRHRHHGSGPPPA